ncbi:MinD/ParA family protein [Mycobacterium sp. URHB0044]|uniref:MinD/ParA family ATP-binding protein n=1 Tax=Mycobacterium sp. URHB0044 TaxID=1380386 RepID=UPI0007E8D86B|nr:MinD/ParA family protein [Mycobacterium sp. URHB0044]
MTRINDSSVGGPARALRDDDTVPMRRLALPPDGHDTPPMHTSTPTPFTSAAPNAPRALAPTNSELGLIRVRRAPKSGWRRAVYRATGLNLGESAKETNRRALIDRVNRPVRGPISIAVLSQKGGVGKTTTTVGLGATLAAMRGDRVIAVDANPDFGTLAQRGPDETDSTVRDVLLDDNIVRYSDMRRHTSQGASRLEILASERDPATSEVFSEADFRGVLRVLERFYDIVLTDCGTGLVHSAMAGVLAEADAIVIVASPAVDSARSALATLDWLEHNGYSRLIPGATVVVCASQPGPLGLDMNRLASNFLPRVHALHMIPFDDHLAEGSEINPELFSRQTRQAFLQLAGTIANSLFSTSAPDRFSRM